MDNPDVMVVLLGEMRGEVTFEEPRAKWRRKEDRFVTGNKFKISFWRYD